MVGAESTGEDNGRTEKQMSGEDYMDILRAFPFTLSKIESHCKF
jgi:hypothetical protein